MAVACACHSSTRFIRFLDWFRSMGLLSIQHHAILTFGVNSDDYRVRSGWHNLVALLSLWHLYEMVTYIGWGFCAWNIFLWADRLRHDLRSEASAECASVMTAWQIWLLLTWMDGQWQGSHHMMMSRCICLCWCSILVAFHSSSVFFICNFSKSRWGHHLELTIQFHIGHQNDGNSSLSENIAYIESLILPIKVDYTSMIILHELTLLLQLRQC